MLHPAYGGTGHVPDLDFHQLLIEHLGILNPESAVLYRDRLLVGLELGVGLLQVDP